MSLTSAIKLVSQSAPSTVAKASQATSAARKLDANGNPIDEDDALTASGKKKVTDDSTINSKISKTESEKKAAAAKAIQDAATRVPGTKQIEGSSLSSAIQSKATDDSNPKTDFPGTTPATGNPVLDKVSSLKNDIANLSNGSGQSRIGEALSDPKALVNTMKQDPGQFGVDTNPQSSGSGASGADASGGAGPGAGGFGGVGGFGSGNVGPGGIKINSDNVNINSNNGSGNIDSLNSVNNGSVNGNGGGSFGGGSVEPIQGGGSGEVLNPTRPEPRRQSQRDDELG